MSESNQAAHRRRYPDMGVVISDHHSSGGMTMAFALFVFTLLAGGAGFLTAGIGNEQWLFVALGIAMLVIGTLVVLPSKRRRMISVQTYAEAAASGLSGNHSNASL